MTGIEMLREWANELREAARAYRDGEIGYVPIDVEACQRKNAAKLDAIADQIERETKEAVAGRVDDEGDAFVDMSGARTGIEMLRSYVYHARVHVRNLYINHVSDINAAPLYEKLRECLRQLDEIADRIERETLPRPRFEDGGPVQFGDEYMSIQDVHKVKGICVRADGSFEIESVGGACYRYGEDKRLKRPEPPDTWERIEDDIVNKVGPCEHFGWSGKSCCDDGECPVFGNVMSCAESRASDIVRRCKALAGVE